MVYKESDTRLMLPSLDINITIFIGFKIEFSRGGVTGCKKYTL